MTDLSLKALELRYVAVLGLAVAGCRPTTAQPEPSGDASLRQVVVPCFEAWRA